MSSATIETVRRPPELSLGRLARGLSELPNYRDLLAVLTAHRIRVRYKQSVLGVAWAVLQPLALMVLFVAVFTVIARVPTDTTPYPLFAYAGLIAWTAFASSLSTGAGSLVSHAALVTKVAFPREILPMTYVAAALFDLAIGLIPLVALLAYYGVALTPAVLWVVPAVILLAALATAAALVLAAVNVRYRDVSVAMPVLLQAWMFASPVIYPLSAVPEAWRAWYVLNPAVGIIDTFRRALVEGAAPDPVALGASAAITAVALPAAYLWFKQVDATLADVI